MNDKRSQAIGFLTGVLSETDWTKFFPPLLGQAQTRVRGIETDLKTLREWMVKLEAEINKGDIGGVVRVWNEQLGSDGP